MAKNVTVTPSDGDIQFENASGTAAGRIEQNGDDLIISNAVGNVLFGDVDSDVYIGDGVNSVDVIFEQSGAIRAETGSQGVTLTLGGTETDLQLYAPSMSNLSAQGSETTTLMINTNGEVGTRELGSMAFEATSSYLSTSDVVFVLAGNDIEAGDGISLAGGLSYNATTNTLSQADNNTTYSAGTGLTLTNTTFSLSVAGTNVGGVKSGTDITVDSSGNVSVNNDSHTHDGRYYTETESDTRFTRKYTFNPGSTSSGNRYYVKLFTLDNFDDGVSGILSAAGDYGDADKAMYHIQIGTRTSLSFDVYQTSHSAVADDYNFYYRQAANDDYEIWVRMADYNQNNTFTVLSQFGTVTYNFDSQTLEVPTDLTEVTKHKMYHSGNLSAGTNVSISSSGVISSTDTTYTAATTSANGLMSSTDKTKLDGIESGADVTDSTNVATAGALMASGNTLTGTMKVTGSIIHEFNNGGGYIPFPKGAYYVTTSSSHTGAIKIKLPVHGTDDMLKFVVDIFDYSTGESVTMNIAGYLYQTTGNNEWTNCTVTTLTERTDRDYTVRFGADGTNNCLWIGETNSTWSYPQVIVRDFYGGYSMDVDAYDDNWSISFETSFDTVDETISDNLPTADWDRIEGKPGNATTSADGFMSSTDKTKLDGIASGADVTPSWVPATDPSYITGLSFNGLSSKTSGTGDYATTGDLVSGKSSGGVALTINDGYGNANITWNHQNGIPEQNGNAARIEVNTDSSTGATMYFEIKSGMTSGTAAALTNVMKMTESGFETETGKDITSGGRLYVSTLDTNTTSTAALVLGSSNEIEQRALGDMAFSSTESFATADHSHSDATTSASGFMSSTDKTKLDGISTGADVTPSWVPASDPSYLTALPSHNHNSLYYTEGEMQHFMARALGWVSGYGNASESYVNYDFAEDAIIISGVGDTTTGAIYKAIRVKSGDKVRFTVMVKGSTADTDGLYIRLYQYNGDMPDGKTHVSNNAGSSETVVVEDTSGITDWYENSAVSTSWTNYEYTYTASADGYVSLVVLNWSGYGSENIYVRQPDIQFEKVNDASKLGGTAASSYLTGIAANSVGITELNVSDGTSGQVLTTNGSGTLSFATVTSGSDTNYYLDGIARTDGTDTLVFSVNGATNQSYTFGSNAFTSYTDHTQAGYLTSETYTAHEDTSTLSGTYGSVANGTKIDEITVDANGHITNITTGATGNMTGFYVEDGDGTEVQINNANEWKFVEGGGIDINWTDTSTGSDTDPYDLTFTLNSDLRGDVVYIGGNANNYIQFDTTNNRIDFYAGGSFVARMESDGDLHIKGDVIAFSSIFA